MASILAGTVGAPAVSAHSTGEFSLWSVEIFKSNDVPEWKKESPYYCKVPMDITLRIFIDPNETFTI